MISITTQHILSSGLARSCVAKYIAGWSPPLRARQCCTSKRPVAVVVTAETPRYTRISLAWRRFLHSPIAADPMNWYLPTGALQYSDYGRILNRVFLKSRNQVAITDDQDECSSYGVISQP